MEWIVFAFIYCSFETINTILEIYCGDGETRYGKHLCFNNMINLTATFNFDDC